MKQGCTIELKQILGGRNLKEAWFLEAGTRASGFFPSVINIPGPLSTEGRGLL